MNQDIEVVVRRGVVETVLSPTKGQCYRVRNMDEGKLGYLTPCQDRATYHQGTVRKATRPLKRSPRATRTPWTGH